MALVFVSYSRQDTELVQELVDDLRRHNIPLWFDRDNIPLGVDWDVAIEHALEDASHMLLVLSKSSVNSKNVRDEIAVALDEDKVIIPIMINDCKPPLRVRRIQYTDFRNNYDRGLKAILKVFAKDRLHDAAPDESATEQPSVPRNQKEHYQLFWQNLLKRAKPRSTLFHRNRGSKQSCLSSSTGVKGLKWRYALHHQNVSVQLYIDANQQTRNKAIFDALVANKQTIEAAFGETLEWERLNDNKASRIKTMLDIGSAHSDPEEWPAMQDAMIEAMIRLEAAFRPYLDDLT